MKKQKYSFQKFQKKNSFFQKSFFHFLSWRSTKESTFHKSYLSSFSQKKNKKNFTKHSLDFLLFLEQKKTEKKKQKNSLKKNFNIVQLNSLSSVEKFSLLFLKKRKIGNENFLSNASSFEIWQNFLFKSPKIGNFFPKKKNFMQYWIVPFLGVLFFLQKEEKRKYDLVSLPPYQILQSNEMEGLSLNPQNEKRKNSLLQSRESQNPEIMNFSFPQKNVLSFATQMKEKNDSEQLLEFYTQIFKKNFSFSSSQISSSFFFSLPKKPKKMQTNEKYNFSYFQEQNTFEDLNFQKFLFFKQNSKKLFEEKRNSFNWKWFSFSFLQKNSNKCISNISYFEIPQKAEFFVQNLSFPQNSEKNSKIFSEKSLTPLFDVSKSFFFFDELNRTFSFFSPDFVQKEESDWKNENKNFLAPYFLCNLKNENILNQKNRFFLQKWVKTQKFSSFSKNFILKEDSLFFPYFQYPFFSKAKKTNPKQTERKSHKQITKFKSSSKFESSFFQNLSDFELLYLEKVFQKLNSKKFVENSFLVFRPKKTKTQSKKMQKNKNEIFDFLSFQHFHKKYKNFWKKSFSKRFKVEAKNQKDKKDLESVLKTLSFDFFEKEDEKQFLTLEKSFFRNFLEKRERAISLKNPLLFHFQNKNDFENFFPSFFSILPKTALKKKEELPFQFVNSSLSEKNFSTQNSQFSFFPDQTFSFWFKEKNPLFPDSEKKTNFQFFSSNLVFKKNWDLFFNSQNFQQNFLFETNNFKNAFLFQKDLLKKNEKRFSFPHSEVEEKYERKFQVSRFQIQKKKKLFSHFQQPYFVKSKYFGFSKKQKKFEKVCQAFFSPLKSFQNDVFSLSQKKENVIQKKTKKEAFLLENLSIFFKKNPELASFEYFLSTKKEKKLHEFRTKTKNIKAVWPCQNSMRLFRNFENRRKTTRFSPELVLQRDGFLSFSSQFGKQNQNKETSWFKNSSRFLFSFVLLEKKKEKDFSFQRLEREKDFQKKRRLKKEKLETRRRKKRKRFYPRPTWLTMNVYKKFLKTRHSSKQKEVSFLFPFSFFSSQKKTKQKKIKTQKRNFEVQKRSRLLTNLSYSFCLKKHEKKFLQHSRFGSSGNRRKGKEKMKKYFFMKYKNRQNLKKKSEFQGFSADALFLKNQNVNFQKKTYQQNFQTQLKNEKSFFGKTFLLFGFSGKNSFLSESLNFRKKQEPLLPSNTQVVSKNIENYKISNELYQEFLSLSWKSSFFQKNFKPYIQTLQKNFQKIQSIESQKKFSFENKNFLFFFRDFPVFPEHSRNDFLIRKSVFQKFSWYTNVSNSFSFFFEQKNPKQTKLPEYNRILYARISEVLKKWKFSENLDSGFFHENRRKNEKIFSESKNSFFTKNALFFEKFRILNQPGIPAFSLFSSLFHDNSLKPTGDLPTLRARWAFQKTNFSHFQEQNSVQNLWAFQKRKTLFRSLKGMKNIFTFFGKFQTPYSENSLFSSSSLVNAHASFFSGKDETNKNKKIDKKTGKKEKRIQKAFLFFAHAADPKKKSRKKKSFSEFARLDTRSFQKFQNIEKKALLFGLQSFKEKKTFLRNSKYQISYFFQNQKNRKENEILFKNFPKKVLKNKNRQNSAKSSFHFWWDRQSFEIHNFRFLSMQLHEFKKTNSFSLFDNDQKYGISQKNGNNRVVSEYQEKKTFSELFFLSTISFSVFGSFFFHFAIFSSLFKIPEIRSLFKFTFLFCFKFWRSFFVVFFSISTLFQKYIKNGLEFFKKKKTKKNSFFFSHFFDKKNQGQSVFFVSFSFFLEQKKSKAKKEKMQKKKNQKKYEILAFSSASWKTKKNDFLFEFLPRLSFFQTENIKKKQKINENFQSLEGEKTKKNELKKQKTFQNLSKVEKTLSQFALSLLLFGKKLVFLPYQLKTMTSFFFTKIFEVIESVFYGFYKFLEKPAEFMIESIAFVFFLEWSADMLVYFPESIESSLWKSSQKLVRPVRAGIFVFPSGIFFFGVMKGIPQNPVFFQTGQDTSFFNPFQFFVSTSSFHFWNLASYILQKRLLSLFETFPSLLLQPEKDILVRQRNGILFWDIWGEILLKAAEKYNVNLPSFATLKEEQELFVEKLVENTEFFKELRDPSSIHFQYSSLGGFSFPFSKTKKEQQKERMSFQNFSFVFPLHAENPFFDFEKKLAFSLLKKFTVQNFFPYSFDEPPSQFQKSNRWQCNQYSTFQSQESDFFLDISPPTSLKDVHFLKYYQPPHSTVGSLICQIYAGVFPKKIAKNILVVGESGSAKTFFLRALAGETEMKIITENASRYAMVQRGVAVGMKYLRDVFDALALQTPCFFVMEDLHLLGAKRPFLLSENESSKTQKNFSFGLEQEEVHERNQMIYQSSRHSISDFRRPYKGDFSMTLPSNFFLQTFYSPFFSGKKKRNFVQNQIEWTGDADSCLFSIQKNHSFENSQFSSENFRSGSTAFSSPLPIDSLVNSLDSSSGNETIGIQEKEKRTFASFLRKKNMKKIQSCLQFSKLEIFAPPATSPFPVFMMKEQKKLKPIKLVQELPKNQMSAFSAEQIRISQKENTSVRAKISALAEKTMNLSRGKFDMITDFLVILDSVRSNRGFVVFGTTHKPSSLDPALRRPGRFDETLSLSRNPNFLNRFEIFKMNFGNSVSFDFFDMALFTENFSEIDLFDILSQTKLSFFHSYKYSFEKSVSGNFQISEKEVFNQGEKIIFRKNIRKKELYSQTSPSKAFHALLKSSIFEDFYGQKNLFSLNSKQSLSPSGNQSLSFPSSPKQQKSENSHFFPKRPSHMMSLVYSKLGVFLADSLLFQNPTSFRALHFDIEQTSFKQSKFGEFYGTLFYASKNERNLQLQVFFAGKISEFFASSVEKKYFSPSYFKTKGKREKTISSSFSFFSTKFGIFVEKNNLEKNENSMTSKEKAKEIFSTKMNVLFFKKKKNKTHDFENRSKNSSISSLFEIKPANPFSVFNQKEVSWTVFGNDENWRFATPFLFSILQKRFLFTKNLLLAKMLFFENMEQRRNPPSPPTSSILIPAKKYENFKRTEFDFFEKKQFSINEKIQMHQKQRFLKQLYNIPVQESFRSELRKNQKVHFRSAFQEFASLDSALQKSSSSHSYFKKYIQIRHRFSNRNQWWNGMFPEHTRESTYLSDVDWRTMFLSEKDKKTTRTETSQNNSEIFEIENSSNETFEFLMDFPDAEQYYNPRKRRWFFSSNVHFLSHFEEKRKNLYFPGWHFYEKDLQYEIFSHFFIESFYQSFSFFEEKREMLDFCAFHLLQKGFLKEFHFLTIFSRF